MVVPGVPTIQTYFSTTATIASWITAAYLIVGGAVSPLFGKLGDTYGKKKMFLVSLIFYMAGVAMAGMSPSIYFLIIARGLQGIGFAVIPLSFAILTEVFPREKLGMVQGIISATYAIGAAAGLIFGSYVIQYLGWQYAFYTTLILSVALFFVFAKVVPKDILSPKKKVDYLGASFLMSGIVLLLVYITEGPSFGWLSIEEVAILSFGAIFTISFFVLERKRTNQLMPLGLLRIRNVLVANLTIMLAVSVMLLYFYAVVYYATNPLGFGLGLGVIAAGLTIAPSCLAMIIEGPAIGALMRKIGPKPVLILGSILQIAGLSLFMVFRATSMDVAVDSVVLLAGTVSILVSVTNMIAMSLPRESITVGYGINMMLRNIGGAIGPVVTAVIMTTYASQFVAGGDPTKLFFANANAFNIISVVGIAFSILIVALSLIIKNYKFTKSASTVKNNDL